MTTENNTQRQPPLSKRLSEDEIPDYIRPHLTGYSIKTANGACNVRLDFNKTNDALDLKRAIIMASNFEDLTLINNFNTLSITASLATVKDYLNFLNSKYTIEGLEVLKKAF